MILVTLIGLHVAMVPFRINSLLTKSNFHRQVGA
jgi:hypothetical protein